MTYPAGHPQYQNPYPPPYPPASRPSPLPAYLAAALFLGCAALSLLFAVVSWSGRSDPRMVAAVIGVLYTDRVTGNIDFGISMTMTVACTTATFAVLLLARLAFARWFLAGLGGLVTAYYACAVVYLAAHQFFSLIVLPMLAMLLWAGATAAALLPSTARATQRPRRY